MGLTGEELETILNTTNLTVFVGRRGNGQPIQFAVLKCDSRSSKGIFLTNDDDFNHLRGQRQLARSMGFKYGCSLESAVSSVCNAFHDINKIEHITLFELV